MGEGYVVLCDWVVCLLTVVGCMGLHSSYMV